MRPGETIEIRALHADRVAYRWWSARVDAVNGPELVVSWPGDTRFHAPDPKKSFISKRVYREYFWMDRHFNIAAGYKEGAEGPFERIYADITSLPWIEDGKLFYIDHELDVIRHRGKRAFIVDQDEFAEAITTYGYTDEFQKQCWTVTEEVRRIVDAWEPGATFSSKDVSPLARGGKVAKGGGVG